MLRRARLVLVSFLLVVIGGGLWSWYVFIPQLGNTQCSPQITEHDAKQVFVEEILDPLHGANSDNANHLLSGFEKAELIERTKIYLRDLHSRPKGTSDIAWIKKRTLGARSNESARFSVRLLLNGMLASAELSECGHILQFRIG